MERKEFITSTTQAERTIPNDVERTATPAPLFDDAAVKQARPAEPLRRLPRWRTWPVAVGLMVVTAGLIGGVIGGVVTALYQEKPITRVNAATQQNPSGIIAIEKTSAPQTTSPAPVVETRADDKQPQPSADAGRASDARETNAAPAFDMREANARTVEQRESKSPREQATVAEESQPKSDAVKVDAAQEHESLRGALGEWIAATNSRNVEKQMNLYAPKVNSFYLTRNVSRAAVRAEKARVFGSADEVEVQADAPDIKLSPDGRTATMRFRKRYAIAGEGQDRRGEVLQELRWRRTNNGWRIVSERDLRVLNE